jgi:hypothetical protein
MTVHTRENPQAFPIVHSFGWRKPPDRLQVFRVSICAPQVATLAKLWFFVGLIVVLSMRRAGPNWHRQHVQWR